MSPERPRGVATHSIESGSKTLKDALNEAMRDWVTNVENTFYIIGTVAGPHPYPMMVRDFQSVIGREARRQMLDRAGRLPDVAIACVGGGSNAIGLFHPLLDDPIQLLGVEAGGTSPDLGHNAATISFGSPGVLHGSFSYLLPAIRKAGALGVVTNGWDLHGLTQMQSGNPFAPSVGFDRARLETGFGDTGQRPDLLSGDSDSIVLGGPDQYFNPLAFGLPAAGYLGTLGRGTLRACEGRAWRAYPLKTCGSAARSCLAMVCNCMLLEPS